MSKDNAKELFGCDVSEAREILDSIIKKKPQVDLKNIKALKSLDLSTLNLTYQEKIVLEIFIRNREKAITILLSGDNLMGDSEIHRGSTIN